ncbi:MAG: AAA family ATPase [Gammaproteobacteria bacterium]|nr:AAA family ATPase [Gammaproteobacteria bacterium]
MLDTEAAITTNFSVECKRLITLGRCVESMRNGKDIYEEYLGELKDLQQKVQAYRANSHTWNFARKLNQNAVGFDLIACIIAPELDARIGLLYQYLQPGQPSPYPSLAVVQELLALDDENTEFLRDLVSDTGLFSQFEWLKQPCKHFYDSLMPSDKLLSYFLNTTTQETIPPGTVKVSIRPRLAEVVLPASRIQMLKEFMMWVNHRDCVYEQWGAQKKGGPVALFTGPSGTGKTYAGAAIATELGWPLYRVSLSQMVSKYVGETEKNMDRLFNAAHMKPMVLQFDEAESLFGKRGEIKEARDRYASNSVCHLLARIDEHIGPCILTTNQREGLDAAFTRRFQSVINFPRPDSNARAKLWNKLLPPNAPVSAMVDPDKLGEAVNLTGGGIHNVCLYAAFLAADKQVEISYKEIGLAVWRELSKVSREVTLNDVGFLADYLDEVIR